MGEAGGEGEGQYMLPSYCRLSTLVLKVKRDGVSILRFAPRCAAFAIFGGLLRGKYLTTYLFYPFGQSLNCWRRSFSDIFHSLCDIYIENAKNGL